MDRINFVYQTLLEELTLICTHHIINHNFFPFDHSK